MFVLVEGKRKYRIAYIGLPRKNGKSTILSGLGLYGMLWDGEHGAEVYAAAGDRTQARIIFGESRRMVKASPELLPILTPRVSHIEGPDNSVYRVLSADAALQQGLNPSIVLFDEVHVQPDENLWDALTLGSGTRRQPYIIGITTAGHDMETLAGRLYDYGRNVESGQIDDPTFFFRWFEAPTEMDYRSIEAARAGNPALADPDGFLKVEDFTAAARTTQEGAYRRFRLNQWTATESPWLPPGAWKACESDLTIDPKKPVAVGIDLSRTHDSTAVLLAQRQGERTIVRAKFWINPFRFGTKEHDDWLIPKEEVFDYLRALRKLYPAPAAKRDGRTIDGPAFCYDPWGFREDELSDLWKADGLNMVAVPQHAAHMGPQSRTLYELIVTGAIAHDGDPTLAAHLAHVVAKPLGENGWRLEKPKGSIKKIDGAIALVMAVAQAQEPLPARRLGAFIA